MFLLFVFIKGLVGMLGYPGALEGQSKAYIISAMAQGVIVISCLVVFTVQKDWFEPYSSVQCTLHEVFAFPRLFHMESMWNP